MRTCEVCGQALTKEQKRFCSRKCRNQAAVRSVERVCRHCGKVFFVKPWQLKHTGFKGDYCSQACHYQGKKGVPVLKNRRREVHQCAVCGKAFETGGRIGDITKRFCSTKCRRAGRYRHGTPAKTLTDLQAAYLAGIVDGEGSIMAYMRDGVVGIRLNVCNTKRLLLEWLRDTTGVGYIATRQRANAHQNESHLWVCTGESAETILTQIRPYLILKAAQTDLALDIRERLKVPDLKADRTWQVEFYDRMKALNRRGQKE